MVAGVVICLERSADLHMAQLMPLLLTVSFFAKIQIGFTFWYRLTREVPEKGVCVWQMTDSSVREYVFFVFFSDFKKT